MKRLVIASLVAALILMVWGFLYWGVNPLASSVLRSIEGEDAVLAALNAALAEDGTYFVPMEGMDDSSSDHAEKHKRGPIARISFRKAGADPMSPSIFVMGFIHFFMSAFVMGMLVMKASPLLPDVRRRWNFIVLVACFATLFIDWSDSIWMYGPTSWAWFQSVYHIVGWAIAGGAMAALLKPPSAA